jgi:hypothetical protein
MKKPIYTDVNAANNFQKSVTAAQMKCNQLIEIYQTFQPFHRISTLKDWMILVRDPVKTYDDVLISNVNLKVTGDRSVDPGPLANMIGLDRESYLNMVSGKPLKSTCLPCQKISVKKGQVAISHEEYQRYQDFLLFIDGGFSINQDEVNEYKKSYDVYAESPAAVDLIDHYEHLVNTLNDAITYHQVNYANVASLAKMFNLTSYEGKVMINEMEIALKVKYLNLQKI